MISGREEIATRCCCVPELSCLSPEPCFKDGELRKKTSPFSFPRGAEQDGEA